MECQNCKNIYNETDHVPRLLIQCGHSLCEKCTYSLYSNHVIKCPECSATNYASSIDTFPRNLALLLINKSHLKRTPSSMDRSEIPGHALNHLNSSFMESKENTLCSKHKKKIEGFL